jgi:hypothetical protein
MLRTPSLLLLLPIVTFAERGYVLAAEGDRLVYTGVDGGPSPRGPKLGWKHPPPAASQEMTQTWTIGSTQTLKWHAAYPTVLAVNLVQEGTHEEAAILPGRSLSPKELCIVVLMHEAELRNTKGVGDHGLTWKVDPQGLSITESRVFSLVVVAGSGDERPESQRSAQFVIVEAEVEAVPDRTFRPSKPQAAAATVAFTFPATTLMTIASPAPTASNTRTDCFTFQPPSPPTSSSSPTALEAHSENDGPKYRVVTAVAAIAAIAGVVSMLGFAFWLWRRVTGMRMAAVGPGHHVVGPNEFVVMDGEAWLDKTR